MFSLKEDLLNYFQLQLKNFLKVATSEVSEPMESEAIPQAAAAVADPSASPGPESQSTASPQVPTTALPVTSLPPTTIMSEPPQLATSPATAAGSQPAPPVLSLPEPEPEKPSLNAILGLEPGKDGELRPAKNQTASYLDTKPDYAALTADDKQLLPTISDIESALDIKEEKPLFQDMAKSNGGADEKVEEKPDQADMDGASALAALASAATLAQNNVKQETNGIKSEVDEVGLHIYLT